jgi:hypothetical protein
VEKGSKLRRAGASIGITRSIVLLVDRHIGSSRERKRKIWPRKSREGEKRSSDDCVDSVGHSEVM